MQKNCIRYRSLNTTEVCFTFHGDVFVTHFTQILQRSKVYAFTKETSTVSHARAELFTSARLWMNYRIQRIQVQVVPPFHSEKDGSRPLLHASCIMYIDLYE